MRSWGSPTPEQEGAPQGAGPGAGRAPEKPLQQPAAPSRLRDCRAFPMTRAGFFRPPGLVNSTVPGTGPPWFGLVYEENPGPRCPWEAQTGAGARTPSLPEPWTPVFWVGAESHSRCGVHTSRVAVAVAQGWAWGFGGWWEQEAATAVLTRGARGRSRRLPGQVLRASRAAVYALLCANARLEARGCCCVTKPELLKGTATASRHGQVCDSTKPLDSAGRAGKVVSSSLGGPERHRSISGSLEGPTHMLNLPWNTTEGRTDLVLARPPP